MYWNMKNTKYAIIMIASIMVIVGTTLTPVLQQQVKAAIQLSSQHMNQGNLCYRNNTCRQSEVGQNTLGNDNQVTGFADQSDNLQEAAAPTPVNQTTTPTGNQTTTPLTCEQCFAKFLTTAQITALLPFVDAPSIAGLCAAIAPTQSFSESGLISVLTNPDVGVSVTTANELIACLKAAGIVFAP